jgi:hypothetical protein
MDKNYRSGLFTLTSILLALSCLFVKTFELNATTGTAGGAEKDAKTLEMAYRKNPADLKKPVCLRRGSPLFDCNSVVYRNHQLRKSG